MPDPMTHPSLLVLPLVLLLELTKRVWHEARDDRATVAHGAGITVLWLLMGSDMSWVGHAAFGLAIAGWLASRLTIGRPFWRRKRWRRWDLWHLTFSPMSSWPIELAFLWSVWPL